MTADTFQKAIVSLADWRYKQPGAEGPMLSHDYRFVVEPGALPFMTKVGHPLTTVFPPLPNDPGFQPLCQVPAQDFEYAIAALCAYREMRGDLYDGMRAVLHVLRNRATSQHWHHSDVYLNTVATSQFSAMTIRGDSQTVVYPFSGRDPLADKEFEKLLPNVEGILNGADADNSNGAIYYAEPEYVSSPWFKKNIEQNPAYRVSATIGKTLFWTFA